MIQSPLVKDLRKENSLPAINPVSTEVPEVPELFPSI